MPVFRNSPYIYKYPVTDIVARNLQSWLSYGFLEAGAYTNITYNSPTSGYTSLKSVHDDRYAEGQVFEMFGPGLVWETDIVNNDGSNTKPLICSGIKINNVFYPASGINPYPYTIDFNNARVIFSSPIDLSFVVSAEYCIRDIGVYQTDAIQFKNIITSYSDKFLNTHTADTVGLSETLKDRRVWLPSVFIDCQTRTHKPMELGSFSEFATTVVMLHVFAETPASNKQIMDIINDQVYSTIDCYDLNLVPKTFNFDGSVASGAVSQKVLGNRQGPYYWRSIFVKDGNARPVSSDFSIFRSECKYLAELARY